MTLATELFNVVQQPRAGSVDDVSEHSDADDDRNLSEDDNEAYEHPVDDEEDLVNAVTGITISRGPDKLDLHQQRANRRVNPTNPLHLNGGNVTFVQRQSTPPYSTNDQFLNIDYTDLFIPSPPVDAIQYHDISQALNECDATQFKTLFDSIELLQHGNGAVPVVQGTNNAEYGLSPNNNSNNFTELQPYPPTNNINNNINSFRDNTPDNSPLSYNEDGASYSSLASSAGTSPDHSHLDDDYSNIPATVDCDLDYHQRKMMDLVDRDPHLKKTVWLHINNKKDQSVVRHLRRLFYKEEQFTDSNLVEIYSGINMLLKVDKTLLKSLFQSGKNLLFAIAQKGNNLLLQYLIELMQNLDIQPEKLRCDVPLLHKVLRSVANRDLREVFNNLLIVQGKSTNKMLFDINEMSMEGETPLMAALDIIATVDTARKGIAVDMLQVLLSHKPDLTYMIRNCDAVGSKVHDAMRLSCSAEFLEMLRNAKFRNGY